MEFPYTYGNLYGGFNTRRYTLVHGFFFVKLLFIGPKELNNLWLLIVYSYIQ